MRISRTALLTIYFDSPFGTSEIVAGITNQTFDIFIVTQKYAPVNYTVNAKDFQQGEVELRLLFQNPAKISATNVKIIINYIIDRSSTLSK
jgi:hypothetical protein